MCRRRRDGCPGVDANRHGAGSRAARDRRGRGPGGPRPTGPAVGRPARAGCPGARPGAHCRVAGCLVGRCLVERCLVGHCRGGHRCVVHFPGECCHRRDPAACCRCRGCCRTGRRRVPRCLGPRCRLRWGGRNCAGRARHRGYHPRTGGSRGVLRHGHRRGGRHRWARCPGGHGSGRHCAGYRGGHRGAGRRRSSRAGCHRSACRARVLRRRAPPDVPGFPAIVVGHPSVARLRPRAETTAGRCPGARRAGRHGHRPVAVRRGSRPLSRPRGDRHRALRGRIPTVPHPASRDSHRRYADCRAGRNGRHRDRHAAGRGPADRRCSAGRHCPGDGHYLKAHCPGAYRPGRCPPPCHVTECRHDVGHRGVGDSAPDHHQSYADRTRTPVLLLQNFMKTHKRPARGANRQP